MAGVSKIEWTECTWNPVTGCTKISPGCDHCYAERLSKRLQAMGAPNYSKGFDVCTHDSLLTVPLRWKKPKLIFVNSMSDLFHPSLPVSFIQRVFQTMVEAHWHTFQVLTKRATRLFEICGALPWPPNVWMGVTVENKDCLFRMEALRNTPAQIKFVSFEPLLGPLTGLDLKQIDWVVTGGESGPGARPIHKDWIYTIRYQCQELGIPFFFKQWGGFNKKKAGRMLDGKIWEEMPSPKRSAPQLLVTA